MGRDRGRGVREAGGRFGERKGKWWEQNVTHTLRLLQVAVRIRSC